MVKALKFIAGQPKQVVERVVKIAADARAPHAGSFRFQVKDLAEHPTFPEKPAIPPGAIRSNAGPEVGNHAQAESAVRSDFLVTTGHMGSLVQVHLRQAKKPKIFRAAGRPLPEKRVPAGRPETVVDLFVAFEKVESRGQAIHPVDE